MGDATSEAPEPAETAANGTKDRTERSETAYPYFGLSNGIAVMEAVRRAGGSEAPSAEVMRELGISKVTDRRWAYGIPAASQFGLVERVGRGENGRIKLTELGMRVALPGPGEGRVAKVAAFKTPELYTKLLVRFGGHPVPPKDGLKNILHREFGIVESMAPLAADAFLDSLKVAELVNADNIILAEGGGIATDVATKKTVDASTEVTASHGMQVLRVPQDFIIYRCKLSGGRVIDVPLPPKFKKSDLTKLTNFLGTQVDDDEGEEVTA
jgi:hypothetical protein